MSRRTDISSILIIGADPIVTAQAVVQHSETQAARALKSKSAPRDGLDRLGRFVGKMRG